MLLRSVAGVALLLVISCLGMTSVASFAAPTIIRTTTFSSPPCIAMASFSSDTAVTGPSILLDEILKGNSTAATTTVEMLMDVRGTDTMEQYLEEMLPQTSFPLWTRLPLMTKVSERARKRKLYSLIELSKPTTEEQEGDNAGEIKDTDEARTRRARSSLFLVLRSMANNPDYAGVSSMLKMAKRDAKAENISSEEMLQRTPDLETPKYKVLKSKGGFEVRRYEKFSVCSVTMKELKSSGTDKDSAKKLSNPQLSGATSFGALAGYLFGKNEQSTSMKMTTPVFSEGEGADRKMSFVLPSDYWQDEGRAPKPLSDSAVQVSSVDGNVRAVIFFSGFGRKNDVENRSKKLRDILGSDKEWCAVDDAKVVLAQYNDPL